MGTFFTMLEVNIFELFTIYYIDAYYLAPRALGEVAETIH